MDTSTQAYRVVCFLKNNPNKKFTAKQLAVEMVASYPEIYDKKVVASQSINKGQVVNQVAAEIGANKSGILKTSENHVFWQDKPRPRLYWYDPDKIVGDETTSSYDDDDDDDDDDSVISSVNNDKTKFSEHDLYPILIDYLKSELGLYSLRIDEKRSKNSRGGGGNQWLHPDIVSLETIGSDWHPLVRSCIKQGGSNSVRLWSFEVKKELSKANVRKSFFQAVSNSSWANEGFLVATSISDGLVTKELNMLSTLHGIGVIILNVNNPSESDIIFPAASKNEVDWESINRILKENPDFKNYIELIETYHKTGRVKDRDWFK